MAKKKEWEIVITADTNDADYITKITAMDNDTLKKIKPLVKAIKAFEPYTAKSKGMNSTHRHNWPDGECLRDDLGEKSIYELYSEFDQDVIDTFRDLCPTDEYGIHTIESVEVQPYVKKVRLL